MYPKKMSEGGRVVIPAEIRRAFDIRDADTVIWDLSDGAARLTTRKAQLRRIQEDVLSSCGPPGPDLTVLKPGKGRARQKSVSVVDELIAERRADSNGKD